MYIYLTHFICIYSETWLKIIKKRKQNEKTQIPLMTKIRNFRLGISTEKCNKFNRQYICYVVETKIKTNKMT